MEATLAEIEQFLIKPKTLAIVGASTSKDKAGYSIPKFLQERGWKIVPINPKADEFLGEKVLDDLEELDQEVDGVIIYRNPKDATKEAKKAVDMGISWVWLPVGVTSKEAREYAQGVHYVENKCPKPMINKWVKEGKWSS